MTKRLYYTDPYRTHFTAHIVEKLTWQNHPAVVLDRTAFYPASGGQPADRGTLGNVTVLDVVEREADGPGRGPIVHVLSDEIATDESLGDLVGEIAWQRRFDHMQQHTGQHILSAAFEQVLKEAGYPHAATVGFHLGATSSTIDIDVANLGMEDVMPIEAAANEVVWDDRPIGIRFVDSDAQVDAVTAADLSMADPPTAPPPDVGGSSHYKGKRSDSIHYEGKRSDSIRLIEIPGPSSSTEAAAEPYFDVNPCGGTHVARTGEVGMIKIVGLEHRGDKTRIEFLCGGRALQDYEAKRSITTNLANMLTVGTWELDEAVERLREENKQLRHAERKLRQRLLDMESGQLVKTAAIRGPYRVVGAVWQQRNPGELQALARKLTEQSDVVALLFSVNERTHFCFARAEALELDVNQLLQEACAQLDGKGGGRPQVAQGSAPRVDVNEVRSVLHDLEATLEEPGRG